MSKSTRGWLWVVAGLCALLVAGKMAGALWDGLFGAQKRTPEKLVNQFWIERLPRGERDMVYHLLLAEVDKHRVGVVGRSSHWRSLLEGARWRLEGDQLQAELPQRQQKVALKVRTWECKEGNGRFELCLELSGKDRQFKLYSRKDWVVDTGRRRALDDDELPIEVTRAATASVAALQAELDDAHDETEPAALADSDDLFAPQAP